MAGRPSGLAIRPSMHSVRYHLCIRYTDEYLHWRQSETPGSGKASSSARATSIPHWLHSMYVRASIHSRNIKELQNTRLTVSQLNAAVVMDRRTEDMKRTLRETQLGVDQILNILSNEEALRIAADLQKAGEPVATHIMDVGKQVRLWELPTSLSSECNTYALILFQRLQLLREQEGDPSKPVESEAYRQTERGMSQLFSWTGIPPTVRTLNGEVTRRDDLPYVGGTYSDIWIGFWLGSQKVCGYRLATK